MIMLSMYADVRRAWYEARSLITEPHIPSDTERTQSNGDKLRPLAPLSARFRRTLITAIYWALLVGLIVGGAGFVGVVTKTTWGVASYLVTLAIATYLVLAHSRLKVPPECVALTKLGHNPRLLWGPLTYDTWPISENLIGIIPLYTLCLDSERFQVIIVNGMLVVRIRLCYRVSTSGDVGLNVLNVARETLDSGQRTGRSLLSLRRTLPVKTSQEALNRRLSADLRNSVFEISLGKTYQALAENLDKTSRLLCRILSEKVEKWGLEIVNVKLLELGMPESAKGT
jgi:hypothetical protein